ncbi:secondary thiamine-phosphate synthase enzyme YjbQ [Nitratifractor sp.]
MIRQKILTLPPMERGVHLITPRVEREISGIHRGLAHLFLRHTSASLAINENYDPQVRRDIESFLRSLIPDCWEGFGHTLEGCDDMPAHMKNILIGPSLTIPVAEGRLALGTWQGIYLLEHREHGGGREILLTLVGE